MKRLAFVLALVWFGGSAEGWAQPSALDEQQYVYVAYLRIPRSEIGDLKQLLQRRILPVLKKNSNAVNDEYNVVIEATRAGFLVRIMTRNPPAETMARLQGREVADSMQDNASLPRAESIGRMISQGRPIPSEETLDVKVP